MAAVAEDDGRGDRHRAKKQNEREAFHFQTESVGVVEPL
jgi:hypothetical protein